MAIINPMYGFRILTLGLLCACQVNLSVPSKAVIECASDAECPTGLVCASAVARCRDKSLKTDIGPRLQSATSTGPNLVVLVFDKPVVLTETAPFAVGITGLTVTNLEIDSSDSTRLSVSTSKQLGQVAYDIVIEPPALTDEFANPILEEARQAPFNGFGPAPDTTPPSFILPVDGEQFSLGDVTIVWSGLTLVESYFLDVWTQDPAALGPPTKTYETLAPATSITITLTEPTTHWLRLRSNATRAGAFSARRIEMIGDTVYVDCPANLPCDDATTGGNLANPRRSVARALIDAQRLGASKVLVAARGEDQPYAETIDLFSKLTLRGGYDSSFSEAARSTTLHRTILQSNEPTIVRCTSVKSPPGREVLVEGLELVSTSSDPSSVVNFVNCDKGVTLNANVIRNAGTNESRVGVFLQSPNPAGADGPSITNNQILSGLGIQTIGVNTRIEGNSFAAGGIPEAGGVFITGGNVDVIANTIEVDKNTVSTTGGWVAIYALQLNPFQGAVRVLSNSIEVADSTRASDGVIFLNADGEIRNNVITTGDAPFSNTINLSSNERISETRHWEVTDNVLNVGFGTGLLGTSAAIYIGDAGDRVDLKIARNRGGIKGLSGPTNRGLAAGIYVGSENGSTNFAGRSNMVFENNAFDVGPASLGIGAGSFVFLLGATPNLSWVNNTFRWQHLTSLAGAPSAGGLLIYGASYSDLGFSAVNNLLIGPSGPSGGSGGVGIFSQEKTPPMVTLPPVVDHNLVTGAEQFASFPNLNVPVIDADGSLSNTLFGEGNAFEPLVASLLLGGANGLTPTSGSPNIVKYQGENTYPPNHCGLANDRACGSVSDDLVGASRTCFPAMSQCTSIGAYEVD